MVNDYHRYRLPPPRRGEYYYRDHNSGDILLVAAALATFEKLSATPWLDICARELRASGVPTAEPAAPSTAQLSPQEHQVVYLAGLGLTNPQIAARLHLSTRTVSGYLYRSFPKLGVTSRHQIRDIPPPPTFPQSQDFG